MDDSVEEYPEFHRADGECLCVCGQPYRVHGHSIKWKSWDGSFWLRELCDGTLVKL
jgi:hypothetical protein